MAEFLGQHSGFVQMRQPHPWHHPDYQQFADQLEFIQSSKASEGSFVSGVSARFETRLAENHWQKWLVQPIDFIQSMQAIKERYGNETIEFIEIGFHPVLEKCCGVFSDFVYVSSMYRGETDLEWILNQRKKLNPEPFLNEVRKTIHAYKPQLVFADSLAYQGLGSLEFAELSVRLQSYFPTLAPQDFYRYKTINQLIDRFGLEKPAERISIPTFQRNEVVIAAMSCRFPSAVETLPQLWEMLLSEQEQVKMEPGRGGADAGYLTEAITRFDHQYFGISSAEAATMDPQQILALELTEMLWKDAGIDPNTLNKKRIGVYMGVWTQEYEGDRESVYYPTGTNPSIIAARISYHYDLRGPSWVSNTACSSSLVAVHYAMKDIEAGRLDYAIAGGINMLLDETFTSSMRNSGFLSADNRCKTFDDTANGYVRAEGGGLVLLANKSLATSYYAELIGSAINQNGGRPQVITAPHPQAQEEVITDACEDAGIQPRDIAYIECHGTGTKIGDPIEISAIQNTVARDRKNPCYVGSVKSVIGHLESAAGIAGLIKSVAALHFGKIPPNLQFDQPNRYIDFASHHIRVVTQPTKIDQQAFMGISSFGFGGSNAHIIVKGADASVRKEIRPLPVPFDRQRGTALDSYLHRHQSAPVGDAVAPKTAHEEVEQPATREAIDNLVDELFVQLTGIESINPEVELINQGLDSMSGTELISLLQKTYSFEIDPEILFEYPFKDQFVDRVYELSLGEHAIN
jgi:acyl transferase domain-containing protein/acyl carrier protein